MIEIITISDRIKEAMCLRNMKQCDLVEKTGIGKSSISTYLTGAYEPKQRNIGKLAKALNVNEAWLMGNDVSPQRVSSAPPSISDDDLMLLNKYHALDDGVKNIVENIINTEYERVSDSGKSKGLA